MKALTASRGVAAIETAAEAVTAAAEVLELVRATPDVDAYLIACFGDPAVEAARELTDAPVVGIGEAAYRAAAMLARRFAVITTLPRGVPDIETQMDQLGVRHACVGVLSLGIPVAQQGAEFDDTNEAIVAAGRRAVLELGAEALVLACGGMAQVEARGARTGRRTGDQRRGLRRAAGVRAVASGTADQPSRLAGAAALDVRCRALIGRDRLSMFAAAFREYGGPEVMRWEEIEDPVPGPDEVLIDVRACGLNHSDLDSRAGSSRWPFQFPHVLGAEFAGYIAQRGAQVEGYEVGQPVTALQQYACGRCPACVGWRPDLCARFTVFGTDCWGGYAELVRVPDPRPGRAARRAGVHHCGRGAMRGEHRVAHGLPAGPDTSGRDGAGAVGVRRRGGGGRAVRQDRRRAGDRHGW